MSETPLLPASNRIGQRRDRINCHCRLSRLILPASITAAFLLFIFTAVVIDGSRHRLPWQKQPEVVFPKFSHYKYLQTLLNTHFPLHPDDAKRVVVIGDIHGMNQSLSKLLATISYNPQSDTLIHSGDIVPKSKWVSSVPVLSFMSTHHVLGVRGNNDQKVIEWKAWMHWIESLPGGREWLEDMDSWSFIDGDEPIATFNNWLTKSYRDWEPYVPSDWKLLGKHYKAARDISEEHFDYLCSLPLVLYAPTAHTFFVHAGVLPADPTRDYNDPKQPLSHLPTNTNPDGDELALRGLQELALLNEIPQNGDPWVLLNMRSISKDGEISKSNKKGVPWSYFWNDAMEGCSVPPANELPATKNGSTTRRCFPLMVVYGHAAARDLDVKRWSVGLDTGCAYGRQLTAIILDAKSLSPQTHSKTFGISSQDSEIPYGDKGTAKIISVECDT